ncbi:MAG: hypothetical protein ACYST6_02525 [Planctomycetota bacterium]|jgi:hypothetical protein
MRKKRLRRYQLALLAAGVAILVIVASLALLWHLIVYMEERAEERAMAPVYQSMQIGDRIVEALNLYRADTGHYPVSLEMLVPKYLDEIPAPTWGEQFWRYNQDGDGFSLRVMSETGDILPFLFYRYREKEWQYDDWW